MTLDLAGYDLCLVTLDPGVAAALERDRLRDEKTVGARWTHLRDEVAGELSGIGLWLGTGALTVGQTVAAILTGSTAARVA
jgi:hypothetical protein